MVQTLSFLSTKPLKKIGTLQRVTASIHEAKKITEVSCNNLNAQLRQTRIFQKQNLCYDICEQVCYSWMFCLFSRHAHFRSNAYFSESTVVECDMITVLSTIYSSLFHFIELQCIFAVKLIADQFVRIQKGGVFTTLI